MATKMTQQQPDQTSVSIADRSAGLEAQLDAISGCERVDELSVMLQEFVLDGVRSVALAAACVKRLQQLDPEIEINSPLAPYLRKVADGLLLPELLFHLKGGRLLARSAGLPLEQQRAIANDRPLRVMQPDGDHHMIRPSDLSQQQVSQVFDGVRIRSDTAQLTYIRERDRRRAERQATTIEQDYQIDYRNKSVIHRGESIPLSTLTQWCAALTSNGGKSKR